MAIVDFGTKDILSAQLASMKLQLSSYIREQEEADKISYQYSLIEHKDPFTGG